MKRLLSCAAAAAFLFGSIVHADDEETRDEQPRRQRIRIVERIAAKHWIGVHAVPIDDALKSQLNLEDRLIVRAVMVDGPAAKGGLKQHDILLKLGDREIRNLEDLLKAVAANEDKAVKVVVLRAGKELTVDIQPTEWPADVEANLPEDLSVWKSLEGWLGGPTGGRLRIVGPGVLEELPVLPGNLSITVTKQNDEPARITVKRDGDAWEITENEIDDLPEEIREHVRRHLDGQPGITRLHRPWKLDEDGTIRVDPRSLLPEGADAAIREQMERALKQLEQIQRRFSEGDPFKAVQDELKSLRREVEKLREGAQPKVPPAADARDT